MTTSSSSSRPQTGPPLRFAVVDVETTGLSLQRDRVLQVGVVVVDAVGNVLTRWESLVRPRNRWFFRVGPTELHGIRRRDVRGAPSLDTVMRHLATDLESAIFVAHNASFDVGFLRKAAAETDVHLPVEGVLCTLALSRALDPERTVSHRLGAICERYGVTLVRPHDALADADATAAVLRPLLEAHGIATIDEVRAHMSPA